MNAVRNPIVNFDRSEDRFPITVLVISPNASLRQEIQDKLGLPRWQVAPVASGAEALEFLKKDESSDIVLLLDPMLPDLEPSEFNAMVRDRYPAAQVLMLNSHTGQLLVGSVSPTPVSKWIAEAVNCGSSPRANTIPTLEGVASPYTLEARVRVRSMIGESDVMLRTYTVMRMVAARDTTVLITGESGTGKDLVAQEIHLMSPRRKQPFVVVNCAAIPEALLEAELFGYTKGAFTGAAQSRIGRIQAAQGGTLFLDEIGDMPLSLQSKILRFLEQGEVQRLGGNDNFKVDVRVIAATNAELKRLVTEQRFREDLYYRLAVFPIHLPPLRERMSDIEELAAAFVAKFGPGLSLSNQALQVIAQHNWPGNVRELRNVLERASILVGGDQEIMPRHILL